MSTTNDPSLVRIREIFKTLRSRWMLWAVPTVCVAIAAAAYAQFRAPVWEASQAMLVREETGSSSSRPGRFENADSRKTAQETLLEIARNPRVVTEALLRVGPPADVAAEGWPRQSHVLGTIDGIKVAAPKGSELGRSEVIYLSVKQPTRQRAIVLTAALCDQLDMRLRQLRNTQAESLIRELEKTVELARADLDAATNRIQALESRVGSDLGELRSLTEAGSGEGNLRQALNKINEELRQATALHYTQQKQLESLQAALKDPGQLEGMPSQLLELQPSLRRLKEGLAEAQLASARLLGKMSPEHPAAQAALAAEQKIRESLRGEIQNTIRGLEQNVKVGEGLVATLDAQLADCKRRYDRLADLRAPYSNLVAEMKQRSQTLEAAEKALADARASRNAAESTSLLTRMDSPQAGDKPLGPGRTTIAAMGLFGGLAIGMGLVFLLAPLGSDGRRWTDFLPGGRRLGDRLYGRRNSDAIPAPVPAAPAQGRRTADRLALPVPAAPPAGRRAGDQTPSRLAIPQQTDRRAPRGNSQSNPLPSLAMPPIDTLGYLPTPPASNST